jgi:hypothetical protein
LRRYGLPTKLAAGSNPRQFPPCQGWSHRQEFGVDSRNEGL